jgi:hypothetical protein
VWLDLILDIKFNEEKHLSPPLSTLLVECAAPVLTTIIMEDDTSPSSQEARNEMARLWRTWRTVHEMLRDRVGEYKLIAFYYSVACC